MKKKKSNLLMMKKKTGIVLMLVLFLQSFNTGVCRAQSADEPRLTVEFKETPFTGVLDYIKRHTKYEPLYNKADSRGDAQFQVGAVVGRAAGLSGGDGVHVQFLPEHDRDTEAAADGDSRDDTR